LKRCENGHYFDPAKHTSCPSCGVADIDFTPTRPKREAVAGAGPEPQAKAAAAPNQAADADRAARQAALDAGKTVPLVRRTTGIDPVVGWLVCVEGADRGRDYRIHGEKNFVGRSPSMDICIAGDDTISRENQAAISFNPKNMQFKLHPGEGRGLVYLNDVEVDGPMVLKAGDRIELGQTKLMFVPLCGETFSWVTGVQQQPT
jgi:hypothetical protein